MDVRAIRLRIKSVTETRQITRAMKLISAAKLKKARNQLEKVRPFFDRIEELIALTLSQAAVRESPWFKERSGKEGRRSAYLVLSGDKGLAGNYNSQIIKLAESEIDKELGTFVFVAGIAGKSILKRRGYRVVEEFDRPVQYPTLARAREVAVRLMEVFRSGEVDEVHLIYTRMQGAMKLEPVCVKLLPLSIEAVTAKVAGLEERIRDREVLEMEPDADAVFAELIPLFLRGIVYDAFVESFTSEQSARMMAMDSATGNADALIERLRLEYNRARQAAITQELAEIVGGAAAQE